MIRIIFFFFITFLLSNYSHGSSKENIIKNFEKIENLSFNFKQIINDKEEKGHCIIKYSKKIFCSYKSIFNKILVSNGRSLVIKSDKNKQYYLYPLKKTPLNLILNKDFLIKKFKEIDGKVVDNKYYTFSLDYENNIINIFFDNNNYNIMGWQTEDIYQNLAVTFIYNLRINEKINNKLFLLPKHSN
tara:strand:+ start:4057 stop:4617 length:561 start_codon:yes stop_codon:yes gene_type:complete